MMNSRKLVLAGLTLVSAALVTILVVSLASAAATIPTDPSVPAAPASMAAGMNVTGVVTTPDGGPLPTGTWVWLWHPDPDHDLDQTHGGAMVNTGTGAFSFAGVEPGDYYMRAVPPDLAPRNYAPSVVQLITVLTQSVSNLSFQLSVPSITGTLYAPGGITPTQGIVHMYRGAIEVERRWVTAPDGGYVVGGLMTDTYRLVAEPWPGLPFWWSPWTTVNLTPTVQQYVPLTLQPAQVTGRVVDSDILPLPVLDARVDGYTSDGKHRVDYTSPDGKFALGNLSAGTMITLFVDPPPGKGALLPFSTTLSVPAYSVPLTLTTSPKYIFGWVRTTEPISRPVSAHVEAHRVDRLGDNETDTNPATGYYSLALAPGLWQVKISPVSGTTPSWVYPFQARSVSFANDLAPEFKQMDFRVVIADSTVQGTVELPPPGSGVVPPFTVTVSLHNDDGIGLDRAIDANGHFSFTVPHGGYKLNFQVASGLYAAPEEGRWVYANPITPTLLHTITLRARDAYLVGTLTDNNAEPVPDVPVVAWNPKTHATFESRSNSNGVYVTAIYSGTWLVRPAPLPTQPYVYTGAEQTVSVLTGQTVNLPFSLLKADATIHGILQDEKGNAVTTARGWAGAKSSGGVHTGAPIAHGEFDILVPGGTYTVALDLPNGQLYMAGSPQTVGVSPGETQTATFTLIKKTALIYGAMLNRRDESPAADVDGKVWAWSSEAMPGVDLWAGTDVKPSGLYALGVPAGVWRVNYSVDPDSNFIKAEGPRSYALQDQQSQRVDLPVVRKDSWLNGYITLPDGTPVTNTLVVAEGISKELEDVTVRAQVDQNGYYTMSLPFGLYNIHATPLPGYINPKMKAIYVARRATVNVSLQYRQPDAWITGVATLDNPPLTPTDKITLWAWTADDGYSEGRVRVGKTYSLPVTSGESWKMIAVYELGPNYWMTRTVVAVPTPGVVTQDLTLVGPRVKPAPVSVVFDASQDQSIELSDGTRIYIPGGAMPVDGRVILHITPLAAAPHHRNGDVLGLHYAFEAFTEDGQPITQDFDQDVAITFKYDTATVLAMGLDPNRLRPAYFSTTTNSWTRPDSFVADQDQHEITLQINHFTMFGLVNTEGVPAVYLPMVSR